MKIGIFTAMDKECQGIIGKIDAKHTTYNGYEIYEFEMSGKQVVLIRPITIGEIAAAAAVQVLITRYNVDVVLNFGVVGSLTTQTALLSTVYVGDVVHYDLDTSEFDGCEVARYLCFEDVAIKASKDLLDKALSVENHPVVRCASADKFVYRPEAKQFLHDEYGAEICDMESAAVIIICRFNNVPCLCVKTVSDSLIGGGAEYAENAVKATQGFFDLVVKLLGVL